MFVQGERHYFKGIAWFMGSLVVCESNDVITKLLERNLSPLEVIFGRFFLSTLILLPLMLCHRENFRSRHLLANFLRGFVLFSGMYIWCYGLDASQLSVACLINFTTPMFTLFLATFLLKEKIGKARIVATAIGFLGVAVVLNPHTASFPIGTASLFLLSAVFFALLDVLNKMLVTRETMLGSLFFTGFFTMLLAFVAMGISSKNYNFLAKIRTMDSQTAFLFVLLGVGANFLFFFILKALNHIDVSATAPFRYVELILASLFGYLFFGETISLNVILGSVVIIPSVIYLVRFEARAGGKKNKRVVSCCC
jgi:S-adenosylmethionine uptake transporter